jgi:hypothetical protein
MLLSFNAILYTPIYLTVFLSHSLYLILYSLYPYLTFLYPYHTVESTIALDPDFSNYCVLKNDQCQVGVYMFIYVYVYMYMSHHL